LIDKSISFFFKPTGTLSGSNDSQEDDSGCDLANELLKGESLLGLSLGHGNTSSSSRLCFFVLFKDSDDCAVGLGGLLHQEDSGDDLDHGLDEHTRLVNVESVGGAGGVVPSERGEVINDCQEHQVTNDSHDSTCEEPI